MSNTRLKFRQWSQKFNRFYYWGFGIDSKGEDSPDINFTNPVQHIYVNNVDQSEQFTGLCDRNGVEIYEGDICRQFLDGIDHGLSLIVWHKQGLKRRHLKENAFGDLGLWEYEVIGNIHQNLELL